MLGVSQKTVKGKPRSKPERQCQVQEAERMGTQDTYHRALARRIKSRTQRGCRVGRTQPKAINGPRALGHLPCLSVPHTLQALLTQRQKHWLKRPGDKQKLTNPCVCGCDLATSQLVQ